MKKRHGQISFHALGLCCVAALGLAGCKDEASRAGGEYPDPYDDAYEFNDEAVPSPGGFNVLDHIPDPSFREYCAGRMNVWDTDDNGILSLAEAARVTALDASNASGAGNTGGAGGAGTIADLTGIKYFTGLRLLGAGGNVLRTLDVSGMTSLTSLNVGSNRLTGLDVSTLTGLTHLIVAGNPGDGISGFVVRVWFDPSFVPANFPAAGTGWAYNGIPINLEYQQTI